MDEHVARGKIKSEFTALRGITASKKQTITKDYLQKNVRIKPTVNALGLLSSIALSSIPQVNYCQGVKVVTDLRSVLKF